MSNDAFTAGIEHGGLTTDYEVRILICWLLSKVDRPVTMGKLNEALQQDALVNYFELARGTGYLLSTGHIVEGEHGEREEAPLVITPLGRETGETLERSLPLTVREKSLAALRYGVKTLIIPKDNASNILDIPQEVKDAIKIHLVENIDEVFDIALEK